jgi:hypothetical protein
MREVPSSDIDEEFAVFNFHWVSFEIDADRRALCCTCSVIKAAVVLWAFDSVIHNQAIAQVDFFVGAQAVGGVIFIIG